MVVTTEEYAQELISEMPLFKEGGRMYVPQTKESLDDIANRIWDAFKAVLEPFIGRGVFLSKSPTPYQTEISEDAVERGRPVCA